VVLRAAIGGARDEVLAGRDAPETVAKLPGLIALEARIAAVREWPLDPSNVARVWLYLALGLGSWLGAATVERLIDWLLVG
jgi:hypothetical protein